MNQMIINSTTIGVVISVMGYELGLLLKRKFKSAIFNPLLISIIFVICCLLLFRVDYDNYNKSAQYLSYLLTPATVCLAIPLYQQIKLLKENVVAIFAGIISGVLTSLVFIFVFALIFNFGHEEYVTLLPKSITTAIGMGISEKEAEKYIKEVDEKRTSFHKYCTDTVWGDAKEYQLCLDTGKIGFEKTAELIMNYINAKKES